MLHLKPPAWAEAFSAREEEEKNGQIASGREINTSVCSSSETSSSVLPLPSSASPASPLIAELVSSLTHRRLYRELLLALRLGLENAQADFSFLRVKGLKALIKALSSLSASDVLIRLFQDSQTDKTLQVVPVLFEHSLAPARSPPVLPSDPLSLEGPLQVVSAPTDYEVALALRVLEGCCLLDKGSRVLASQHMAIKEVIELLSAGGVLEQGACLDALPALLLDTPINQQDFLKHQGVKKISELVKHGHVDKAMRLKCSEFLLLLVGDLLPSGNEENAELQLSAEGALEELHELLGDVFLRVLEQVDQATASLSISKAREEVLRSQAKLLLELIDSSSW
ncbi:hypothetical protein GOP47_0004012 [Adiantum capillus-veneris]|uniref:Uncharacterized protein n=1 Tax=Adiantum capillus-veneris TaxID=13818 RepID=A0A9D4ZMG4_ADICA|nr:hypothetical protein GOP47_0004012 [Adiantum capillus-veneris]